MDGTNRFIGRRRSHLRLLGVILAGGLALAATGCGSDSDPVRAGSDGVKKISIVVGAYPVLESSVPWIVGQKKGLFAEHGVEVEKIIGSAGGSSDIRNALAADAPIASVGTLAAAEAVQSGIDVTAIAGPSRNLAGTYLVASKKSGITNVKQLAAATKLRWGYTSAKSVTESLAYLSIAKLGLKKSAVDLVAAGGAGEAATLLGSGDLDVAYLPATLYVGNEKNYGAMLGAATDLVPEYSWELLITTPEILKAHRDVILDVMKGYAAAVQAINDDPAEAGKLWAAEADIDPAVATTVIENAVKADEFGTGSITEQGWQAVLDSLDRAGVHKSTLAKLFDADFMREAGFELPGQLG